ncbi:MAG: GNVR domain-containing protein, partial [Planctomycetota bacterium]
MGKLIENPSREDAEHLSNMQLVSESINPSYTSLQNQIFIIREKLETAKGEELHLKEMLPAIKEEMKKSEGQKQIIERKWVDLQEYASEAKKLAGSRFAAYATWLDQRRDKRIVVEQLQSLTKLREQRYKERLKEMQEIETELSIKNDKKEELERELAVAKHAYEIFKHKVEEARIATAEDSEDIRLIRSATPPEKKVAPKRSLITLAAAVVGFFLSALVSIVMERRSFITKV